MKKKKAKRKTSLFNKILLAVNIIMILLILVSYLSIYINPEKNWIMPIFGLIYPFLLIINLLFLIYWIILRKYFFLFSLAAILIGWFHVGKYIQFRSSSETLGSSSSFKISSYNVKNLANDNVHIDNPEIRQKIIQYLQEDNPDILCLQEFYSPGPKPLMLLDSLSKLLKMPYYEYARYSRHEGGRFDAIVTFSKFPIIKKEGINSDEDHQYGLLTDIEFQGKSFRLFNIHLESFRFKNRDYEFLTDIELPKNKEDNFRRGSAEILRKMRAAFTTRAVQVKNMRELMEKSPNPVVVCGDFNDTPLSYSYYILSHNLTDAFLESGSGISNTYSGKLPSYRIDYIFYDPKIISEGYLRTKVDYSDHYPISCYLMFKE